MLGLLLALPLQATPSEGVLPDLSLAERTWVCADVWANRLADWRVERGAIQCVVGRKSQPVRTLQLLTRSLAEGDGEFTIEVVLDPLDGGGWDDDAFAGFLIGGGGTHVDHRLTAQTHSKPGPDGGLLCVVDAEGKPRFIDFSQPGVKGSWTVDGALRDEWIPDVGEPVERGLTRPDAGPVRLRVTGRVDGDERSMTLAVSREGFDAPPIETTLSDPRAELFDGQIALVSHRGGARGERGFGFVASSWAAGGSKVARHPERAFGPIVATQYTVHRDVLKLTAQLTPVESLVGELVVGELYLPGRSPAPEFSEFDPLSNTCTFRVEGLDSSSFIDVALDDPPASIEFSILVAAAFESGYGLETSRHAVARIRPEPGRSRPFTLAAFTGHKCFTGGPLAWNESSIWFPHRELVDAVQAHDPDLLFFSGDQIYEGDLVGAHMPRDGDSIEDYLYKWYRWCWVFGELTRDRPSVTIPDDHDVYHGNIWGAGGKRAEAREGVTLQDSGGYKLAPALVNAIHRTQVSHLPDPVDATPVENGITYYPTTLDWGGVSFAVLADRMFKSAPTVAVPEGDVRNGWFHAEGFDPATQADVEGAVLLGERQLTMLDAWAADWRPGVTFKCALSQTIFANVATLPEQFHTGAVLPRLPPVPRGTYPDDERPVADADSNGWPRSGRDRAVRALRRALAVHVAGDQHLGSTVRYGVDAFGDAGFALCVPSVANTWPRRWFPDALGANRWEGAPRYGGDYLDGFGNRMTVLAVSNPHESGRAPARLFDRAPGYGIVRFDFEDRTVELANWPRWEDPTREGARPYPGWPVAFPLAAGDGRTPSGHLAPIEVRGDDVPAFRLYDEATGELVYALRASGPRFRPHVFGAGPFRVVIGDDGGELRELTGLAPADEDAETVVVTF